jgi:hypothetical protein
MANLKPVDAVAYSLVRTYIAAGAVEWDAWLDAGGEPLVGPPWPKTDPSAKWINDQIFSYVPYMALEIDALNDNCALTEESRRNATCNVTRYDVVYSPLNRKNLVAALNARTSPDIVAAWETAEKTNPKQADESDLEWYAVAVQAAFFLLVPLPAGAALAAARITGYILAAWVAYGFITVRTPGGQSLFDKFSALLKAGFDAAVQGAKTAGYVVLGVLALFVGYKLFAGSR